MKKYGRREIDGFGGIGLILALLAVILVVAFTAYKLFFIPGPLVKGTEAFDYLPLDKTIALQGENLKSIEITISQNGRIIELLKESP
ncbi:MAG: hypothetical protein OEU95_05575, partial [Nitrospirota bacterium]|nr:hypothetical protein [Nitrospirota bacterium]